MPSGMGTLFNIQTTNLMSVSEQTPFDVTYASQMNETTNILQTTSWSDDWQEAFSENLDLAREKAGELWQSTKEVAGDLINKGSEWLETIDLPF